MFIFRLIHIVKFCIVFLLIFSESGCDRNQKVTDTDLEDRVYKDSIATHYFKRETGLVAGDGGFSIPLPDDRVLWLFGDSYIDRYDPKTGTIPCLFQVRNAGIIQPVGDWNWENSRTLLSKEGRRDLFKIEPNPGNRFFWPGSGFVLHDQVYVLLHNLQTNGQGAFGFESAGPEMMAVMPLPDLEPITYHTLPDVDSISFGEGFIPDKDGKYLYAFGSKLKFIAGGVYIARIPTKTPDKNWEFWDGDEWSSDVTKANEITESATNNVHVTKIREKYVLLSSEFSVGCDMGTKIYASTSDDPVGPFTEQKRIFTIDDTLQGHYPFFYLPLVHPEYINENNELLITYSINGYGDCVPDCQDGRRDPDTYRLQGFRISLDELLR